MTRGLAIAAATGLALSFAAMLPAPARADVRLDVRAEPTAIAISDQVTVQVSVQTRGMGSPEISLPDFEGFEIVGQQVQRPMQFSFGFGQQTTVQSSTIYTFVLQPQREGKLTIKPVRVELDGEVKSSQPIAIAVAGGGAQPAPGAAQGPAADPTNAQPPSAVTAQGGIDSAQVDEIAFLRTLITKAEPYEGEQTTITMYLYVRDRLQSTPSIETEPTTDGLWVHDLMPPSRTLQPSRQIVNGQAYAVYVLRRVAAFPLQAGEVTLGPMTVKLDASSGFDIFSARRARPEVKRSSQPLTLHVKPLPESGRPPGDVAVGRFSIAAKLDRTQAVTGDAVTLTATVQGQGNIRTAGLVLPKVDGLDVLQPEVKDLVTAPDDVVSGTREYRWLIVPRAPGRYTVPALSLATFDAMRGRNERAASNPIALEVVGQALPATGAAAVTPKDTRPSEPRTQDRAPEPDEHVFAPIRTQSALARGYARLVERPWFGWALVAPGLLWLSFVSASALRRRAAARAQSAEGRDLRVSEQRLGNADAAAKAGDAARFHAEASAALIAVLESRMREAVSGFTRPQLRERLRARGMEDALIAELTATLERGEFARFSAAESTADLSAQARDVQALFKRVLGWNPAEVGP